MGKTMITGGLGFVGAHLVRSLNQHGAELTVISRSRNAHFDSISQLRGVRVVIKDLSDLAEDDFDGVDRVYHLASTVHNYHIQTDPYVDVKTNVEGTIRLLEIARRLGRPEIIFASSWFVYGRQDVLPAHEDAPCRPLALYGATKLCAEHCLRSYGAVFGIPFKIVRLGNVFGPGDIKASAQKGALLHLLKKIKASEPVVLYYGGDFVRDYIYVEDAVRGLEHVAHLGTDGEVYNLGSGSPTRFRDLIEWAIAFFRSKTQLTPIEPTTFHNAVQAKDFWLNVDKVKNLGFEFTVPIEKGLRHVCESID